MEEDWEGVCRTRVPKRTGVRKEKKVGNSYILLEKKPKYTSHKQVASGNEKTLEKRRYTSVLCRSRGAYREGTGKFTGSAYDGARRVSSTTFKARLLMQLLQYIEGTVVAMADQAIPLYLSIALNVFTAALFRLRPLT